MTEPITPPSKPTSTCAYDSCRTEFVPTKKGQKYCSANCRARDSVRRKVLAEMEQGGIPVTPRATAPAQPVTSTLGATLSLFDKPAPTMPIPQPKGLDMHTQYIFDFQKKEIQRWEDAYKNEREKRKKLHEEKQRVEKELAELKMDVKLAEVAKPSGLSGFMENPFIKELAPHIAPVLAGIAARALTPAQPVTAEVVNEETAWINTQPAEVQHALRDLVGEIAKLGEPQQMLQAIDRMKKIANGKAPFVHSGGPIRANGTFGM